MSILRVMTLFLAATLALGAQSARGDEVSQQQEAIRAPLRTEYAKAKQAEKYAIDRRQKILDRMSAMLAAGNQELEELRKQRVTTANALVAKRDERRQAVQALAIALGRAGGNTNEPTVKAAQTKLDALDLEVAALEKRLATYEQAERDKVTIPDRDAVFGDWVKASIDLDRAQQDVMDALAAYLIALRPEAPPYLQAVQVYAGTRAMYRAEWRIDDQAADVATRNLIARLDSAVADSEMILRGMQHLRNEFRETRISLWGPLIQYSNELNNALIDAYLAAELLIVVPAIIEAVGAVMEVAISGGLLTAQRHGVEEAMKSGTAVAGALAKKTAGKPLTKVEEGIVAVVKRGDEVSDAFMGVLQTGVAKERADKLMNLKAGPREDLKLWKPTDLIAKLGLKGGSADAAGIIVSDLAEQVIGRTAKAGTAVLSYKTATALAAATATRLTTWQAIRSGTVTFFTAKTPVTRITESFKGELGANILGLCVTAAKATVAAYLGAQLSEAQDRYVKFDAMFDYAYNAYYVLLQADQLLAEHQREAQELHFQLFAYRLQSAGPRRLVVVTNEGNNDPTETLTFALHFSQPLDRPPQVRIAGLAIEMRPQDADDKGRAAHWEGRLAANKLPDSLSEGVLEVRLGIGNRAYAALDANPASPARFIVPDDLNTLLADREEWSDYERGPDRNHRIAFRAPKQPQTVPWRSAATCDKINCDCGVIPIAPGLGGDLQRKICQDTEQALRNDCVARKQTFGACPPDAGPAAYPPPR